jgi:Tfp pilus tip-associated adhesin PilY1
VHNGTPTTAEREWRTLGIGGYREGGVGYYALDLTQPDPVTTVTVENVAGVDEQVTVPQSTSYVPRCNSHWSSATCGPLPYPSLRWEFTDACDGTTACAQGRKDEDANGQPDLGFTWSKPNTGRVRVVAGAQTQTRYVAIFGGGYDPTRPTSVGNFLYMVDIETGKVLWKRAVSGAVPSEPAAVDTDQNGLLDTIYVGTVSGHMYKVDVSAAAALDADGRVSTSTVWAPLRIFDTEGRPIFLAPTVTFIAQTGRYALGFGTGDRENLWSETLEDQGRFYMIVDEGFTAANRPAPLAEADYELIEKDSLPAAGNLLIHPLGVSHPGWVLALDPLERVTSEAFSISGLVVFNTYTPTAGPQDASPEACVNQGFAGIYALLATNGNALGLADRERITPGFASSPYAASTSASGSDESGPATTDAFETEEIRAIRDSLKGLFPPSCRFGSFGMRLAANISNTSHYAIAEVPICIVEKAWKEF